MAIAITTEQALSLAPDPEAAKAARSLATPRPWSSLGRDDRAIWGACQGSGKDPYKVQIDWLGGPAFKCTCPSRKFPCKHGLALLMLLAAQPGEFGDAPPAWVSEWLTGRDEKAEKSTAKKAEKAAAAASTPVDEKAQAKRAADRVARVRQGLRDLSLWLADLVGQGIASTPGRPYSFWDQPAARLVDAQAPGAARLVRELAGIAASGEGWQHRFLAALGRLHLLINAFERLEEFGDSPATVADVRAAVGFTVSQELILAEEPPVRDRWTVAGQYVEQEERLRVQRTWLTGAASGRSALILEFAVGPAAGFKTTLMPGLTVDAELCFFPGAAPLRALVKQIHAADPSLRRPAVLAGAAPVAAAAAALRDRLALNPWTETQPVTLAAVTPVRVSNSASAGAWRLRDEAGASLPLRVSDLSVLFTLLALSGGRPLDLFGEWDGAAIRPVSAVQAGRLLSLGGAAIA